MQKFSTKTERVQAAALGTQEYHALMRKHVENSLKERAGYIPKREVSTRFQDFSFTVRVWYYNPPLHRTVLTYSIRLDADICRSCATALNRWFWPSSRPLYVMPFWFGYMKEGTCELCGKPFVDEIPY